MKLPKAYQPAEYEKDIYLLWEQSGVFKPGKGDRKDSFSVVLPPPNANGNLHLGHALTTAIQDVLARYHRMNGKHTIYVPGADHAGFETWVVYERKLAAEGKSRFDYTREELYQQVWDFVQLNKQNFETQFRALGGSYDWDRYTFTLDPVVVNAAYATFKKLWDDGLVYRGERLVNYCTVHGTSFADIEVDHKEVKSKLWHLSYPLTDGSASITVATTRPETMLGDTAVAVHPDDDRYKDVVGKTVRLPLTNREIPIIADTMVDREFGTGAVKITPAHDPADFETAQRHDLPLIHVITHTGVISNEAGVPTRFHGLDLVEARKLVLKELEEQGVLEKEEDYTHSVGHCYKCGTPIQPLVRDQWFIDLKPLAKRAIAEIKKNKITFYPESKKQQTIAYLENLKDWNISRQIAWGIPIPAFQNIDEPDDWIFDTNVSEELIQKDGKTYRRDPDVFDTWFSSGHWPLVTLGYPDDPDFKQFYPLSVMETGHDILQQWVARMIMLGIYLTSQVPFERVYLHGMVLIDGQKMSKSKGNVVDPMDFMNEYGSDALRMGVLTGQTPGSNQPFGTPKIKAARNFCNKLWNIARYIEDKAGSEIHDRKEPKPVSAADHWILERLNHSTEAISTLLEDYRLSEAYEVLYHFIWDDFADWYIEASKIAPNMSVLTYGLEAILKLAHPFAPFVTETIWQTMEWEQGSILASQTWPQVVKTDAKLAQEFEEIRSIVSEARHITAALQVRHKLNLYFSGVDFLRENAEIITHLAKLKSVGEVRDGHGLHLTQTKYNCWLDVDRQAAEHYLEKLKAQETDRNISVERLQARLANKAYVDKAPKEMVEETKDQLKSELELLEGVRTEIKRFGGETSE